MPKKPDYTDASAIFQKSMQEALANLDKQSENLNLEREKLIDEQIAAKEDRKKIERDAHKISEAYIEKHRKEFEQRLRDEVLLDVTRKLIIAEIPSVKLKEWLDLPPKILADAWDYLKFEKLDDHHVAHVGYVDSGRAGTVFFYREDIVLRFPYEFGGGNTLAYIDVPSEANWEKETKLPLSDRTPILNFIANRVVRDQAPNHKFEITEDAINIIG